MSELARNKSYGPVLVKFRLHHARALFPNFSPAEIRQMKIYEERGEGFTLFYDGSPIAAAGICIVGEGVGSAWGLITDAARQRPVLLHKTTKRLFNEVVQRNKLRRVDVLIHPERDISKAAKAWAERLGFKFCATMENFYADGTPALFYDYVRRSDD